MRNTKNNIKKTALLADGVIFTIKGFYDHGTNELMSFKICCAGDSVCDTDTLFSRQMNIDKPRSTGRFLTLYSFDLMRNRTISKIKYTNITILN
jgi:hypothetical protein